MLGQSGRRCAGVESRDAVASNGSLRGMDRRLELRLVGRFIPVFLIAMSLGCDLDPTGRYLVMIAALFLLGAVGEVIFARTQIPDVVWLILAGVGLNVTGLVNPDSLDPILPLFSALTLVIVLFDGGRQIVIHDLIRAAPRASAMAGVSFIFAVLGVAVVLQLASLTGLLPESWTFMHSLMVGAMIGGSSSLIIMPSMNLAKVEPKVSNLVGLESALTDALCVVVAVVLMNIIKSGEASGSDAVLELGENFGLALAMGLIAGWAWIPVLRALAGNPYGYPVTLAALLLLYVAADSAGGNPAMAVLTFSVIVGNAEALMKMVGFSLGDKPLALDDTVVTVHTQAAFVIKSFFFTYIGLMLSRPVSLLLLGFVVGISLFVTRIPAVMLVARTGFTDSQRKMISISLPRGMAAGVLATLPASAKYKIAGTEELPSIVFAAVVTSIAIFAYGFRKVRSETPSPELPTDAPGSVSAPANALEEAPTNAQLPVAPAGEALPAGEAEGTAGEALPAEAEGAAAPAEVATDTAVAANPADAPPNASPPNAAPPSAAPPNAAPPNAAPPSAAPPNAAPPNAAPPSAAPPQVGAPASAPPKASRSGTAFGIKPPSPSPVPAPLTPTPAPTRSASNQTMLGIPASAAAPTVEAPAHAQRPAEPDDSPSSATQWNPPQSPTEKPD